MISGEVTAAAAGPSAGRAGAAARLMRGQAGGQAGEQEQGSVRRASGPS